MRSIYWAHSARSGTSNPDSREGWQPLAEHLEAVAGIAGEVAMAARPADAWFPALARVGGLLHDFGKYSDCFQRMLVTGRGKCQHAIHGAMLAYFGPHEDCPTRGFAHVAASIAGHHGGLPDLVGSDHSLQSRVKAGDSFKREMLALVGRAKSDCPALRTALEGTSFGLTLPSLDKGKLDLLTRMLFSCIVDADRLNSGGRQPTQEPLDAGRRLDALLTHLRGLAEGAPEGRLKQIRAHVLADCLRAAEMDSRLFSLSVPTGGGKTLAAMAFALRRASLHPERHRRVIVVIPYLSIIEQNARVYTSVFGPDAVLEHHSGSFEHVRVERTSTGTAEATAVEETGRYIPVDPADEEDQYQQSGLRTETENWDAPLIVTTSVRFFESLFSNRPRDLRRVHNIARSIVILDEVQTLPRRLLAPLLGIMKELTENWGVEFVFSTATLPAFERPEGKGGPRWVPGTLREIIADPEALRKELRRVSILWELETPLTWAEVATRALDAPQCLSIVNLKNHATELFGEMVNQARQRGMDPDGIFHLSTRMCAAHRLRVLDQIRQRLADREACHVVSTQLVEAGVDVDFPLVMRAMGPLDSIIQAAGRADREGKLTAQLGRPGGEVVVFVPVDHRVPPLEYAEATAVTQMLAEKARLEGHGIEVDSTPILAEYFERLYGDSAETLGADLDNMRRETNPKFATLAQEFEMISSRTRDVYVADDDEAREAIAELQRTGELKWNLRRRLQRHVVGLNPTEFQKAAAVVYPLRAGSEVWIAADRAYDDRFGLQLELNPGRMIV